MTVRFQLKTEAPDSHHPYQARPQQGPAFPSLAMQPNVPPPSYNSYQSHHHNPESSSAGETFFLKKEPHSYGSGTPSSSPTPSSMPGHQFADFFHPPSGSGAGSSLITLTNYNPFPTDFHSPEAAQAALSHCPKFETEMDNLNRVRRTILSTPQPM